jgi:hypothetical protein
MRHKETWGLCLLVIADALSTYWLITQGYAVGLAEWYRRHNPQFVRRWLRAGALAYLTLWVVGAAVSSLAGW